MVPNIRRVLSLNYIYKMADESVILDQKSAFNMCLDMPGGTLPIVRSPEDAMDLAYAVRNQLGNLSTDVLNLITFCKKKYT